MAANARAILIEALRHAHRWRRTSVRSVSDFGVDCFARGQDCAFDPDDPVARFPRAGDRQGGSRGTPAARLWSQASRRPADGLASPGAPSLQISASQASGASSKRSRTSDCRLLSSSPQHGRGPRQRRWRSGLQPGDRVANVRRLWRRVRGRGSAARRAGELCAWNIGRQYRQWLWRGLRGLANIARHGGVANLGGSDCARGCFPYYVNCRNGLVTL
jgi:hypothetical protein